MAVLAHSYAEWIQAMASDTERTRDYLAWHLRETFISGLVGIPLGFTLGVIGGLALSAWPRTQAGAIAGFLVALTGCGFVMYSFIRTRGLLDRWPRRQPPEDRGQDRAEH